MISIYRVILIVTALVGIIFASASFLFYTAFYNPLEEIEISFFWPEYKAKMIISDKQNINDFLRLYRNCEKKPGKLMKDNIYYRVLLEFKKNNEELFLSKQLDIYNAKDLQMLRSPQLQSYLADKIETLGKHFFGKIIPWQEATKLFPKKATIRIRDLETGLMFDVKRYGGLLHADIEPLAEKDTEVLKRIYGEWSWKRRAVVAYINGQQYAASINGMPHGRGGIRDNNFNGHFCLHFEGSKVHASRRVDPCHQLMIYKAGGKLTELLDSAKPDELTNYILNALVSEDFLPVRYVSLKPVNEELWNQLATEIRFLRINGLTEIAIDPQKCKVIADVTVYPEKMWECFRKEVIVNFSRDEVRNSWRLIFDSLSGIRIKEN